MARSLIGGLLTSGAASTQDLYVHDPLADRLTSLQQEFGINPAADNQSLVDNCNVVVLAVKPQVMKSVITSLDARQNSSQLFLTIAAGIQTKALCHWLGFDAAIVRAMPNMPALVQSGATALFADPHTSSQQQDFAETIMGAVGLILWVDDEQQLDIVTALSGSGPAYYYLVMEAMENAAHRLGLERHTARLLTIQTALGAAKLALECNEPSHVLRERVTSPGGTTEQAIKVLQDGKLIALFDKAIQAACERSKELATQLGE